MTTTTTPTGAAKGRAPVRGNSWPTEIRALLVATFLVRALGYSYPFLPYHLDELQLSTTAIGKTLMVFGAGWLGGSVLWGWLADRVGRRTALATAMALAAVVLPLLAQSSTLSTVTTAAFVAGIVYDAPRPVVTAAIADRYRDDASRASINAARNFVVNTAAAAAGASGGLLADRIGIPALLWANAAACAACAVIAFTLVSPASATPPVARATQREALRDRRLWLLLLTSLAALTACAAMFSSLPLLMARAGLSAADYGWAQTANAAAVLLLSPYLNRWMSRRAGRDRPMTGMLALSALILGTSMASAAYATSVPGFSLAAALAVPGEIIAFIAAGDVLARISPPGSHGLYAGIWGTTLAGAVVLAPTLASWSLEHGGPALNAATTLTAGVLGAALCWPLAASVRRMQATAIPAR
ncbi:MFS transporter [Streptomyces sp. NPDC020800]|uniref:MFS transporter n=1 Tax=Streptomyces sp. NPDC020800 TaxID=3365092 RepID=UPI0037A12FF6